LKRPAKPEKHKRAKQDKPPKVKSKKPRTGQRGVGVDNAEAEFVLNVDALQGRWRHSSANLGMFVVRGDVVKFDSGLAFPIIQHANKSLEVSGWVASQALSAADEIAWVKDDFMCKWFLEDDIDRPEDIAGLNPGNIVTGKRVRQKVDYKALERKIEEEEARAANSDESSDGEEAKETGMSAREWAKLHAERAEQALQLFERWMLSTRTPQHEERLRRRGSLSTSIAVNFTGAGRKLIEEELKPYVAKVVHREQGTIVNVSAAGRECWRKRHMHLWESAPLPSAKTLEAPASAAAPPASGSAGRGRA